MSVIPRHQGASREAETTALLEWVTAIARQELPLAERLKAVLKRVQTPSAGVNLARVARDLLSKHQKVKWTSAGPARPSFYAALPLTAFLAAAGEEVGGICCSISCHRRSS